MVLGIYWDKRSKEEWNRLNYFSLGDFSKVDTAIKLIKSKTVKFLDLIAK